MSSSSTRPPASSPNDDPMDHAASLKGRLLSALDAVDPVSAAELRDESEPPARPAETPEPRRRSRKSSRKSRNSLPAGTASADSDKLAALERHSRKCRICRHPDREALEADFLDWSRAAWLQQTYHLRDEATIYRHARATGLLERRRENVCMVAEKILEHVDAIETPSAFAILRAVRTVACLNGRGQWTEPPTTHVVVNSTAPPSHSVNAVTISDAPADSANSVTNSGALGGHSTECPEMLSEAKGTLQPSAPRQGTASAVPKTDASEILPIARSTRAKSSVRSTSESQSSKSGSGTQEFSSHSSLSTRHCTSNRKSYEKLELDLTHTKQTPEAIPNRKET